MFYLNKRVFGWVPGNTSSVLSLQDDWLKRPIRDLIYKQTLLFNKPSKSAPSIYSLHTFLYICIVRRLLRSLAIAIHR